MVLATSLALLPVGFVALMALRELRPWWRQLQQIRSIPEPVPPGAAGPQGKLAWRRVARRVVARLRARRG